LEVLQLPVSPQGSDVIEVSEVPVTLWFPNGTATVFNASTDWTVFSCNVDRDLVDASSWGGTTHYVDRGTTVNLYVAHRPLLQPGSYFAVVDIPGFVDTLNHYCGRTDVAVVAHIGRGTNTTVLDGLVILGYRLRGSGWEVDLTTAQPPVVVGGAAVVPAHIFTDVPAPVIEVPRSTNRPLRLRPGKRNL
jgi:hypothetical protein